MDPWNVIKMDGWKNVPKRNSQVVTILAAGNVKFLTFIFVFSGIQLLHIFSRRENEILEKV
jgi:hypothetical protein